MKTLVLFAMAIGQASVPTPPLEPAAGLPAGGGWRDADQCGRNCLFGYLTVHVGTPVPADVLDGLLPLREEGSSMLDLKRAADALGVTSAVVKTDVIGLLASPLPAIAHLHTRPGHFVLVTDADARTVLAADMTLGETRPYSREQFQAMWSGVLLVPSPLWRTLLPYAVGGATFAVGVLLFRRGKEPDNG